MKLIVDPPAGLPLFANDLDVVIALEDEGIPEISVAKDLPRPDRHLLLGMVQVVAVAVQENDRETFCHMDSASVELQASEQSGPLTSPLIVARGRDGAFGALGLGDFQAVRAVARKAVRYFTGTIRLDVP
jgi:hypothetical protein